MTKFRLDKYQIESLSVKTNQDFNPERSPHVGDLKTGLSVGSHTTDKTRYLLSLEVVIEPKKGNENNFFPYTIAIKGQGAFVFEDNTTSDEADHVLRTNGAAILYGMLRGQVNQITAQALHGPFLLPVANFIEIYERSLQKVAPKAKAVKNKKITK